ncbi:DUF4430 domain-containing protein [Filibacter tadaridae]|uniref:Endoglucanase n=1 Tax=Filibacter tadaridae TaxID=2483811 RepID=A0A3P5X172_9BACL|nr:DUF4430 domain-containing protein [Filibacter tadaridae]VDC25050.1 Endoglucanase precursor [Filibacter tadaridae]
MRKLHKQLTKCFTILMSFLLIFSMVVPTALAGSVENEEGSNYSEGELVDTDAEESSTLDSSKSDISEEGAPLEAEKKSTIDVETESGSESCEKAEVNEFTVDLSVDGIDSVLLPSKSISITDNQTALDALKQTLDAEEISYTLEGSSIQAINGEAAGSLDGSDGWIYTVNGETPQVGADVYELEAGDTVRFYYNRQTQPSLNGSVGDKSLEEMIEDTVQYYKMNSTNLSWWWKIVALWGAGENLTDGSWTLPSWQTTDPKLKPDSGDTEHIRYIFGLLAMGEDPSKAWETNRNLYAELAAQQKEKGNIGGINKHVWAMLALDAGEKLGHDVGTWDASKKQQALKFVLDSQNDDGGFALFGTQSDIDITGMVLLALGNYQGESATDAAIERAKDYLKARQLDLENGGFNSAGRFGMGDNSNSLSTSISGLVAVGEDPLAEKWIVNGKTVVDAYRGFLLENGGFKWRHNDKNVNGMSTEQALVALTDIQTGKSVWQRLAEQDLTASNPDENEEAAVKSAIKGISDKLLSDGVRSEWEAIGLAKAGVEIPASYVDQFKQNLEQQVISKSGKGRMKITDVERLTIAATAVGIDPKNVDGKGFNLIEKIYNSEDRIMGSVHVDSLPFQGNNGIIFALIALDSKAYEVPADAKWTRDKLVTELLNNQKSDGSWSLSASTTGTTSIDITAMALIALAPYQDKSNAKTAIDDAVAFLAEKQGSTGGFNEAFVGGITSEATSQVIIALTANGIDPRSEGFTKNGITLLDHLLSFKAGDGGFKHTTDDKTSNAMATEQALQALVAFDLYVNGNGPLYQFGSEESTEPNPEEKPDPEETPNPEETPDPTPITKKVRISVEKRTMGQGDIISPMEATLKEGDTAYTLLQRVVDNKSISISSIGSGPTLYVQAIDGLGEFDGGPLSGWMYSVNGEFPQFSAGIYTLKEGDSLRWQYTRDLGKDVGNSWSSEEENQVGKPLTPPKLPVVSVPSNQSYTLAVQPNEDVSIPVMMEFSTAVLPNLIADRAGAKLEIPSGTSVTSDWDKKIQAPTKIKTTKEDKAKVTKALAGEQLVGIDAHIKVGGSQTITFDKHVSLAFENLGEKEAGFIDVDGKFTRIDKKGSRNSQDDVYAFQDGKDLVIKTTHFTEFVVFETTGKQSGEVPDTVKSAIKAISDKLLRDGVKTEWEAIGLARAGVQVPANYVTQFKKNLEDQVISKSGKGRMKITDIERLTMAATAIGIDPKNVDGKGFNLIEKIYNSEDRIMGTKRVDSLTFQGNNGIIFALIALDSKAYKVPANAKWTRDKLVAELLKYQKADGSWSLETSTTGSTSFDITAMALIALAPYKEQANVKTAIDKAVAFLSKEQGATGGFNEAFVGGITSEAASQVIIALTTNGIDPRSEEFTKNGINLLDHLLSFEAKNGGFKHTAEDKTANSMATEQALQALVAVELYVKGEGALYQFTGQQVKPTQIRFKDLSSHWAEDYIYKAVQAGVVKGYTDGTFRPNNHLTRSQSVLLIVRALELETTDKAPFKDIKNFPEETKMGIAAAYKYGIVKGSNGNFNPTRKVTRAEMALMMQRALAYKFGGEYSAPKKAPFTDFGYYSQEVVDAISVLYATGIAIGNNGKYMPGSPTSRAQATKMLVNLIELEQAN